VLIVDVFDKEKQYQTSLELRDKIKYTVLERKGDCLKMEQNSGNVFEIKGQKLYLRNEQRYWSISSMQWINEVYFNSQP
jgi:RNase P/RNase MRP subunit p29